MFLRNPIFCLSNQFLLNQNFDQAVHYNWLNRRKARAPPKIWKNLNIYKHDFLTCMISGVCCSSIGIFDITNFPLINGTIDIKTCGTPRLFMQIIISTLISSIFISTKFKSYLSIGLYSVF